MINDNYLLHEMIDAIEEEVSRILNSLNNNITDKYYEMVAYQFGFSENDKHSENRGKMIRPLLLLFCSNSNASSKSWENAIPAAAAVELLHNFSLVHDDIQDKSPTRRKRPTIWKKWGIPQAINTGDGLFSMANISIGNLIEHYPAESVIKVMEVFNKTCLDLTRGQFLDISFEQKEIISLEQYWTMIGFKTAALFSTSAEIGAILSGIEAQEQMNFRKFGYDLGLAFQIKDDILGMWGLEEKTGKSITKDLETAKMTLPVVFGLQNSKIFTERWEKKVISRSDAISLSEQLKIDGAWKYSQDLVRNLTDEALATLEKLPISKENYKNLYNLSTSLLDRET
ncbi:polyprenyl synthetase family protein [Chloroflexota bacterium]